MDVFLTTPFSVLLLVVIGIVSVTLVSSRHRSSSSTAELDLDAPRRPPLVPSWIPFLGSALEYGKNVDAFLARTKATHGPIFTLHLAGRKITYVTSPSLISAVYRSAKDFAFVPIRQQMSVDLFGMSKELAASEYLTDEFFPQHGRWLAKDGIGDATRALVGRAEGDLLSLVPEVGKEETVGLREITVRGLYNATTDALFGKDFDSNAVYDIFTAYDDGFPLFAAGLPPFLSSSVRTSLASLLALNTAFLSHLSFHPTGTPTTSSLITRILESLSDASVSPPDQSSILITEFWASVANANWAQYWILAFVLSTPGLAERLRGQLDKMYEDWKKVGRDGSFGEMLCDEEFKRLDEGGRGTEEVRSIVKETLRLVSSSSSIRIVVKEGAVLEGGREGRWAFKKEEMVLCATRPVHFDPSIYPCPTTYNPTRFLTTAFKASHFLPFGGGVSQCEGRFFAMRELVAFTALALHYFDFGPVDGEGFKLPEIDLGRAGFGILHPKMGTGEVRVRVRRRA